jgi:hypothetical protein
MHTSLSFSAIFLLLLTLFHLPLSLAKSDPKPTLTKYTTKGPKKGTQDFIVNIDGGDDKFKFNPDQPGYYRWSDGQHKLGAVVTKFFHTREEAATALQLSRINLVSKNRLEKADYAYLAYFGKPEAKPEELKTDEGSQFRMLVGSSPLEVFGSKNSGNLTQEEKMTGKAKKTSKRAEGEDGVLVEKEAAEDSE